ncbi:MAG: hypothetical protein A2Y76_09450 [Planctomycetes bacterium RBG_13_60_9]|nr:MAG: hypothetical protein A2Y76_09450 [Planctomycetes bacterium RBG_13_60_9]
MILPLIAAVGAIVGTVAVSGHADKPVSPPGQSKPEPEPALVSVTGAIAGQGNPYEISITFVDESFGELAGSYVANPDYPPALRIGGPGRVNKRLIYYYCDHPDHDPPEGVCTNPDGDHDPEHYKCLAIYGGTEDRKTGQVIFPAGSSWRITQKIVSETGDVTGKLVVAGELAAPVTYEVLEWGTPSSR